MTIPFHSADYEDLLKAQDKIAEIAEFVNEQKRKVENIAKCSEVISSIIGLKDKVQCTFHHSVSSTGYLAQREDLSKKEK